MQTSKSMKSSNTNTIEIDKEKVLQEITSNGQYESNGILIKKWENETETDHYLTSISKPKTSFIGILNNKFEREGYGISDYENGDQYFGFFEKDQRNNNGIYFWSSEKQNNLEYSECYYGFWENNQKEKNGIYLWIEEPENNNQFDLANFDAYVGEVENDTYKRGTYLSKVNDEYYLYHGNFDNEGKKTDDNAYFYSSKNDRLLHGKINKDNFVNCYISFFDSNTGLLKDMAHCSFEKDGSISKMVMKEELQKDEKAREENDVTLFRDVILEVDYFGYIYSKVKEIKSFIEENMDTNDVLEDKEKFQEILKLCSDYNNNNIYNDIEKKALGNNNV